LLDTGIRVSEACGLALADLDRGTAMVTGKGNKIRPVYFGTRTARALDRYLRECRRHRLCHLAALFLTQRGALSPDGARERVKVRATQAGLRGRMHPHRLRHTFAHDYLMAGGQERDPKRLAGPRRVVAGRDARALRRVGRRCPRPRSRQATVAR